MNKNVERVWIFSHYHTVWCSPWRYIKYHSSIPLPHNKMKIHDSWYQSFKKTLLSLYSYTRTVLYLTNAIFTHFSNRCISLFCKRITTLISLHLIRKIEIKQCLNTRKLGMIRTMWKSISILVQHGKYLIGWINKGWRHERYMENNAR